MIDLHSHILPEMDDGSKDAEMSHKMLDEMAAQGVKTVAATPHFYATRDLPEAFLERRAKAVERLGELRPDAPRVILAQRWHISMRWGEAVRCWSSCSWVIPVCC